jgi:hypothetical protein
MSTNELALFDTTDLHMLEADPDTESALPTAFTAFASTLLGDLDGLFESIERAKEEIAKARTRHPQHSDLLHHSFMLLLPTHKLMQHEVVYRAHCREILDRVAAGNDTRPGTAAEICCLMHDVSLATPVTSAAAGLYMRMWQAAGLPKVESFAQAGAHHEALEKTLIDHHEQLTRRKLTVAERRLGAITCEGQHHDEAVTCVYAAA